MTRPRPHRLALALVLAFSALLECYRLGQNGWANTYYSAAVKSMLGSLHNFFFVSSDPGGLVSVDKPPVGLWLQTLSAAIFGFHPLSLLLPEALCAVAAVGVMYLIVAPRFGLWPGIAAAAALAVFPSFVASGRDNNLDAALILLMSLACLAGLRAIETGAWRWLLTAAVLVGLAFNTKTLAAYLILPGLAAAWIVCAPGSLSRRMRLLAGATAVLAVTSLIWLRSTLLPPRSGHMSAAQSTIPSCL
jgi:4-amino-4-deoxy-L-arabinose transferase-like glycosyltransferase